MQSVLIIDNDLVFCELTTQLLEPLGLAISVLNQGRGAQEFAENLRPDLIILSAEIEDPKGLVLATRLRSKKPDTNDSKMIVTWEQQSDKQIRGHQNLNRRADEYLAKPVSNIDLLKNVGDLLGMELKPRAFEADEPDDLAALNINHPLFEDEDMDRSLDHLQKPQENTGNTDALERDFADLKAEFESKEQHNMYLQKELGAFKDGTKMLEKQVAGVKKKLKTQESEKERLSDRVTELETSETRLQQDLASAWERLETANETTQQALAEEANQVRELKQRLAESTDLAAQNSAELQKVRDEMAEEAEQNKELKKQLAESKDSAAQKSDQLEKALDDKLAAEMELDGLRSELKGLEKEVEKHLEGQHAHKELENKNQDLIASLDKKEKLIRSHEAALEAEQAKNKLSASEMERKHKDLNRKLVEAGDDARAQSRKVEALAGDLAEQRKARSELEKKRLQAEDELHLEREKATRLGDEVQAIEIRLSASTEKNAGLDKILSTKLEEMAKLKRSKEDVEKDLEASLREKDQITEAYEKGIETQQKTHQAELRERKAEWERESDRLKTRFDQLETEKTALMKGFTLEKTSLLEKFEARRQELEEKLESSQANHLKQKDMVFSLNKKLKAQEESQLQELDRQRNTNETEMSRLRLEMEEEQSRLRNESQKQADEFNKKIVALEQSNTGYVSQVSQWEKRLADEETAHEATREANSARTAQLESQNDGLAADLTRVKKEREDQKSRNLELETNQKEQAEYNEKSIAELKAHHKEAQEKEQQRMAVLADELDLLRKDAAELRQLKEEHNELHQAMEKVRLDNVTLRERRDKAVKAFEKGLHELKGQTLELELEES